MTDMNSINDMNRWIKDAIIRLKNGWGPGPQPLIIRLFALRGKYKVIGEQKHKCRKPIIGRGHPKHAFEDLWCLENEYVPGWFSTPNGIQVPTDVLVAH